MWGPWFHLWILLLQLKVGHLNLDIVLHCLDPTAFATTTNLLLGGEGYLVLLNGEIRERRRHAVKLLELGLLKLMLVLSVHHHGRCS